MIQEDFALDFCNRHENARIIAADGGLAFCHAAGITPEIIVGDFDSVPPEILSAYEGRKDILIHRLKPEKDNSDMQEAAKEAISAGTDEIFFLGATGGRIDHLMANIQLLLYLYRHGVRAVIQDAGNRLEVIGRHTVLRRREVFGTYVSFLALTDTVADLTLTGFKYPLVGYPLTNTSSGRTVSNVLTREEGVVDYTSGDLLMIQSKDLK